MGLRHPAARFWITAVGVAAAVASAAAFLIPRELGAHAWLLSVWTAGVLCILFGAAALISAGLGVREVVEAGSVPNAVEAARRTRSAGNAGFHGDVGWWAVVTGGVLVAIYFVGWLMLR